MIPAVTLVIAGLHGLVLLLLALRIVLLRRELQVGIGDGGDKHLLRRIRAHANFVEYVPTALVVLALLELGGLERPWVAMMGVALLAGRVLHAHGLSGSAGKSFGRTWGTLLTWGMLATASAVAIAMGVQALG